LRWARVKPFHVASGLGPPPSEGSILAAKSLSISTKDLINWFIRLIGPGLGRYNDFGGLLRRSNVCASTRPWMSHFSSARNNGSNTGSPSAISKSTIARVLVSPRGPTLRCCREKGRLQPTQEREPTRHREQHASRTPNRVVDTRRQCHPDCR